MKSITSYINEKLATQDVDATRFPNGGKTDRDFFSKGQRDGNKVDDIVKTVKVKISAKELLASQDAVYLGKSLSMAIGGVSGGDLGSIVSKENRILDGHHRWAATMFNNPNAILDVSKANMTIGDLIPVLRAAGDNYGNKRGNDQVSGDLNVFKATVSDIEDSIYKGKGMDVAFYNQQKAIDWYESIGASTISKRLSMLQAAKPPVGAPARKDMPKIEPEQVDKVTKSMSNGDIDIRDPYVAESKNNKKKKKTIKSLSTHITESLVNEASEMVSGWPRYYNKKSSQTFVLTKLQNDRATYMAYFRGYETDGPVIFNSVQELHKFEAGTNVSRQQAETYRFSKEIALPEAIK